MLSRSPSLLEIQLLVVRVVDSFIAIPELLRLSRSLLSNTLKGALTIIIILSTLLMADGDFPVMWTEQGLPMGFTIADGHVPLPPRDEETDEDPAKEETASEEAPKKDKIKTKKISKKRAIEESQSEEGPELGNVRKKRRQLRQRSTAIRRSDHRRIHRVLSTSTEGSASEPKGPSTMDCHKSPPHEQIQNQDAVNTVPANDSSKRSSRADSSSEDHSITDYEKDYEVESNLDAAMGEQEMRHRVYRRGYRSDRDDGKPK